MNRTTNYSHAQRSPFSLPITAIGLGLALASAAMWGRDSAWIALGVSSGFLLLAATFSRLKVEDAGDALALRYGPLPVFGTRIPYNSMRDVRAGRTALIDGLGIHWVPGRGWTYNLWGRSCVAIHTPGSTIRVGTDDASNLERFLKLKVAAKA
jgi:hypothetical protein